MKYIFIFFCLFSHVLGAQDLKRSTDFFYFSQQKISTLSEKENEFWGIASYKSKSNKTIYALVRKANNNTEIKLDRLDNSFGKFGIANFEISIKHGLKNSQGESISLISLVKDLDGIIYFIDRFGVVQPFNGDIKVLGNYSYNRITYERFEPLSIYKLNGSFYFYSEGLVNGSNQIEPYSTIARYNSANSLRRNDKPEIPKYVATNNEGMTFMISLDGNKQWVKTPFKTSDFQIARFNKLGVKALNSTNWIVQPSYDVIDIFQNVFFCKNYSDNRYSVYSINGTNIINGVSEYFKGSPFGNCSLEVKGIFIDVGKQEYLTSRGRRATSYSNYYGYISGEKCIIKPNLNYINLLPNGFLIGMKDWGDIKESFIWDEEGNQLHYSDKNYLAYYCKENSYELKDFNVIDPKTQNYEVIRKGPVLNEVLGLNLENLKKK